MTPPAAVEATPSFCVATFPWRQGLRRTLMPALVTGMFLVVLGCLPAPGYAQGSKPAIPASATALSKVSPSSAVKSATSRPAWVELTPMQQQSLKPLATHWDTSMSEQQKRKWIEISKNYPRLPAEGQATLHSRMSEWVALSPEQRAQARLNFAKTKELSKQLTPEEKKAKWQTYQALSAEEKQKLAAKASPKPAGAATAVKPVAPQKLAAIPPSPNSRHPAKSAFAAPKMSASKASEIVAPAASASSATVTPPPGAAPQR